MKREKNMAKKEKNDYIDMAKTFQEATSMSFSIALFPVLFLVLGVYLGNRFGSMPMFVIGGVVIGIIVGIVRTIQLGKKLKK
jgi:F0F1-type ATP synthase assembly protein I